MAELALNTIESQLDALRQDQELQEKMKMANTELKSGRARLERSVDQMKRIKKQIELSAPKAVVEGIVVHAEPTGRRASTDPLGTGSQVRERQSILGIYEEGNLQVDVEVHESRVTSVRPGQTAAIRFDAFPERSYRGKVLSVSSTPTPASFLNPDVKTYKVAVALNEEPEKLRDLRIGMTAIALINIE